MTEDERLVQRLLASWTVPPTPSGLEDQILRGTTRRAARRSAGSMFAIAFAVGAIAAAALALGSAVERRLSGGPAATSLGTGALVHPAASDGVAMAYDARRHVVLTFGGAASAGGVLDATWVWTPGGWQERHPHLHPPARRDALVAYDPRADRTVLFGGVDAAAAPLTDTWTWDGAQWEERRSPGGPPWGGSAAAMAFDPAYGQVLLVTGAVGEPTVATWTWDGSKWTRLPAVAENPPNPGVSRVVEDDRASRLVLVESSQLGASPPSTWTWGQGGWRRLSGTQPGATLSLSVNPVGGGVVGFDAEGRTWSLTANGWVASGPGLHPQPCACDVGDSAARVVLHYGGGTWTWDGSTWRPR